MAIHNQLERSMSGGMKKKIEESAMNLILANLQQYQYKSPIKSTVRELVSNGVDSISEKMVARSILSGEKSISDFFEFREGEEYQDSNFDPSYYDLNWLSDDNSVYLTYIVGSDIEKDKVIITDNGVGLGSYRLEKYFSLGYSTKRLSKLPLGKFGIGGKAALSIGVEYFTMESRYNGRLYRFNIYSHTIQSIIPEWNLGTGLQNDFILFNEGTEEEYKVFYERTTEFNGVQITIDAKKSHKQQYIDAVKRQMLYFTQLQCFLEEDGIRKEIAFKANILYEDEYIILSDNDYWDKPHILINKVNYEYVDFDELELEQRYGNIGIKVAAEEVDVNPSRESILWNDITKETILKRFKQVVEIASGVVTKELETSDYIDWIRACYALTGRGDYTGGTVVDRLVQIADIKNIKPAFLPNPRLKFHQTKMFNGLYIRHISIQQRTVAGRHRYSVDRREMRVVGDAIMRPIYLMKFGEKLSNRKDKWLYSQHRNGFLVIMEPMSTEEEMIKNGVSAEVTDLLMAFWNKEGQEAKELVTLSWDYIQKSNEHLGYYSEVEVPADYKGTDAEVDEEDSLELINERANKLKMKELEEERKERLRIAQLSAKERRKLEGRTLIYTPRASYVHSTKPQYDDKGNEIPLRYYDWQKIEIPIKDMNDWEVEEIYYGEGAADDELIHFAAMLTRDVSKENVMGDPHRSKNRYDDKDWGTYPEGVITKLRQHHKVQNNENAWDCQHFYDNPHIILVKASIANAKYMRDFQPIQEFFFVIRNKVLTISNTLIHWNTARLIKQQLDQAAFLFNFSSFNRKYADYYKTLRQYVKDNYRDLNVPYDRNIFGFSKSTYEDLLKHLDKVKQFQDFVSSNPSDNEISNMAQFMFGNPSLQDGQAVEPEILAILTKVLDYCNAVGIMFNHMPCFTDGGKIPVSLEMEVKQYLEMKGLLDYGKEEEELQEFLQLAENAGVMLIEEPDASLGSYGSDQSDDILAQKGVVVVDHPQIHDPGDDLEIPPDQAIMQEF